MPDYSKGKIYSIRSHQTEFVYIGSTTQPLHKRLHQHRKDYSKNKDNMTSFEIIKYDDHYIELIETYPCANKMELHKREGEIIRTTKTAVNKMIAGRGKAEYRRDNKENIRRYKKKYNEENKELMAILRRKWYEKNKEKVKARTSMRFDCICGGTYMIKHKSRHINSKKHNDIMNEPIHNDIMNETIGLKIFNM